MRCFILPMQCAIKTCTGLHGYALFSNRSIYARFPSARRSSKFRYCFVAEDGVRPRIENPPVIGAGGARSIPALAQPRPRRWTPSDGIAGEIGRSAGVGTGRFGVDPLEFILAKRLGIAPVRAGGVEA
jgi:hypothetical protein